MINGEPEDELRRLVIAYYPADGDVAVFEVLLKGSIRGAIRDLLGCWGILVYCNKVRA